MGELGDKVPAEMKTKVEGKLAELKEAVASGSGEGMKAAQDSLQQEVMAMGQSTYSPTTTTSSTPTSPTPSRRVGRVGRLPRQGAGERDVQRSETLERD